MEIKENKCKLKKQHKTKTKKCPGEPGRNPFRTRGKSIKLDYHYLEINKGLGKRKRHPTGHRIRRRGEREAAKKQSNNKNKKIVKGNGSELKKKDQAVSESKSSSSSSSTALATRPASLATPWTANSFSSTRND